MQVLYLYYLTQTSEQAYEVGVILIHLTDGEVEVQRGQGRGRGHTLGRRQLQGQEGWEGG